MPTGPQSLVRLQHEQIRPCRLQEPLPRFGRTGAAVHVQRIGDGAVGRRCIELVTAADQHMKPAPPRLGDRLVEQSRFADAWFAADDHHAARALRQARQTLAHPLYKVATSHEWAGAYAVRQRAAGCPFARLVLGSRQLHGREFAWQIGSRHLEDALGMDDITQTSLTEVVQTDTRWQVVA